MRKIRLDMVCELLENSISCRTEINMSTSLIKNVIKLTFHRLAWDLPGCLWAGRRERVTVKALNALLALALAIPLPAQQKVESRDFGERIVCIVPMVGTGTVKDPKRPLFVPLPGKEMAESGIVSFSYETSTNGRVALVEIVAKDRAAFKAMIESTRQDVKVLERGKFTKEDLEREFRPHKEDFDGGKFAEGRK